MVFQHALYDFYDICTEKFTATDKVDYSRYKQSVYSIDTLYHNWIDGTYMHIRMRRWI